MTTGTGGATRQAERLLRWYPRSWRDRYGEEFTELLVADLAERPRSLRRTGDVVVNGVAARLSVAGLGHRTATHPQGALATTGVAVMAFVVCGTSLWSQLVVGSRLAPPDSPAVTTGVVVMSVGIAYLVLLALLAAMPVGFAVLSDLRHGNGRSIIGPIAVVAAGVGILVIGGLHVQGGWPGAAGEPGRSPLFFPGHLPVLPEHLAGFGWAETVGLTAYWAHPHDLLALPLGQLVWTVVSPITLAVTGLGAVRLVRRVSWSPTALTVEARLARAAAIGMLGILGSAAWWVVTSPAGSNDIFRAGSLDVLLVVSMVVALAVARAASTRLSAP
ncbi:MAG TPA: hypothetical protein VHW92_07610 [Mycobacteriales bacterium]|nr:hypothetical protein [Mycobacteriales bacterium]